MDDQSRTNLDNETEIAVGEIRNRADKRNPKHALQSILSVLQGSDQVFFHFVSAGIEEEVPQWMLRIAKAEGEMKNEEVAVIHVCRPLGLLDAVETKDPERTVAHSGYVKDGACVRCKTAAPEALDKNFETVAKILKLGKAIS
jgi:hypothetical protein